MKKTLFVLVFITLVFGTSFAVYKSYVSAKTVFEAEEEMKVIQKEKALDAYLEQYEVNRIVETTSFITPGRQVYVVEFTHPVDFSTRHVLYYTQKAYEESPSWHNHDFRGMSEEERLYYEVFLR